MRIQRVELWGILASVLVALTTQGCSPHFYSLHTKYTRASDSSYGARVVTSPTGMTLIPRIDTIAIRPDPDCTNISAAVAEGGTDAAITVLSERCGTTMAMLERAFAHEGYRVIYWSAIERIANERQTHLNQVRSERSLAAENNAGAAVITSTGPKGDLLPEIVARELGVQAIVTVNSIEYTLIRLGASARWHRTYFASNQSGDQLGPARVPSSLADTLDTFLKRQEQGIVANAMPSVVINVSAQFLETNESFFFYSNTFVNEEHEEIERRFFVGCTRSGLNPRRKLWLCRTSRPRAIYDDSEARSGSEEHAEIEGRPADVSFVLWTQLLERGLGDLASHFRSGPGAPPPPRPAAERAAPASRPAAERGPSGSAKSPAPAPAEPGRTPPTSGGSSTPSWLD
jgi:hypothetical protein